MLLARIAAAEDLGMPPVRQLEDPEFCFLMHRPEAEDTFVEMRQFPGATCSRAAPSKTRDLHACQYHHHQGSAHQHPKMRILFSRIAGGLAARNQKARSGVGQSRGRRSLSLSLRSRWCGRYCVETVTWIRRWV